MEQSNLNNQNDEIDLIELAINIWKKKLWVIGFTLLFAVLSVGFALTKEKTWTSVAVLNKPNINNMDDYLDIYQQYTIIKNDSINEFSSKASQDLFATYINTVGSYNAQLKFFKESKIFKNAVNAGEDEKEVLTRLFTRLNIASSNKKNDDGLLEVTFTGKNAQQSQQVLSELVEFIDKKVRHNSGNILKQQIISTINIERLKQQNIKNNYEDLNTLRKKNLQHALQIAEKAGITRYSLPTNRSVLSNGAGSESTIKLEDNGLADSKFLFLLGQKYLSAQLNVLKSSEAIYPKEFYISATKIKALEKLLVNHKNLTFSSIEKISPASLPLQADPSKKALIAIVGTLLGFMIGIFTTLILSALESHKARSE